MPKTQPHTVTITLTVEEAEALLHYAMDDAYYGHEQRMEGVGTDPLHKEDARAWSRRWRACVRVERKVTRALKR